MAFLFGAANTDHIACGAIPSAATFSVFARFKLTQSVAASRNLVVISDAGLGLYGLILKFSASAVQRAALAFNGSGFQVVTWDSGFVANALHTLVGTYAGTDATPKVTGGSADTPITASTFTIGNDALAPTDSADATI